MIKMKEFECINGDYLFKLDDDHSSITVYKDDQEYDSIPNNYNRVINKGEFLELVHHYTMKYIKR